MKTRIGVITTALSVFSVVLLLQGTLGASGSGTTSAAFLKLNPDAKTASMGDGGSGAYADSAAGMIANPASMIGVTRSKVTIDNVSYFEGIRSNYAGLALPLNFGVLGLGVNYFSYGAIDGYDTSFSKVSLPDSYDMAVYFGYAIPIRTSLPILKEYGALGLNVKVIRSKLADYSAESVAMDLGGVYNIPFVDGLTLGVAYKNLGSGLKYVKKANDLPTTMSIGMGYKNYNAKELTITGDMDMPSSGPSSYSFGISISPLYFITLRGGWKSTEDSIMSGLRAGLGLKFGSVSLDYAFSPAENLTPVHHIGLTFAIGNIFKTESAFNYYLEEHYKLGVDYYYKKDYILAKQEFENIIAAYPDHEQSKKYLEKIQDVIAKAKQKEESKIANILVNAKKSLDKKDYIESKTLYSKVLQLDNENLKAKEGLKIIAEVMKQLQAERTRQDNSRKISKLWEMGERYFKNGNFIAAKDKFKEILAIDADHAATKEYMTEIDNQLKKSAAVEINKMYDKGTEYYLKGVYDEAMKYFEAVLLSAPQRLDAKDFIDKCREKIKADEEKKKADILAAEQKGMKKEIEEAYTTAERYYEKGKFEQALDAFLRSNEIADKYKYADYKDKISNYIVMTKSALSEMYYKEGFNYFQKNKFDEAVSAYRASLKYDPENTSAKVELERISSELAQKYYERGMTYFSQGDMDKAKSAFQKSLSYDPKMKESQRALERIK